jgi:hypothetical protein
MAGLLNKKKMKTKMTELKKMKRMNRRKDPPERPHPAPATADSSPHLGSLAEGKRIRHLAVKFISY